ncbi:MAG TPA: GNAT family N-acetyltransferase [Candidatus Bathyarchaeia archaeon]|nr:GNAT family N-acetyltransferase [Candidatus Bathyarchaeia archaeon]
MALQIRLMQPIDVEKLHGFYEQFALNFVGPAKRQQRQFQNMARRKDNLRWVALNERGEIVGYISATYAKGRRTGRVNEIVIDPKFDFETVAGILVDKVQSVFLEKGAAQILAGGVQNPDYSKMLFILGFWHMKTDGVFMYVIIDIAQFLNEITPLIVKRLNILTEWNGLLRIACENHHKLFKKEGETVQTLLSTSDPSDCDIMMNANGLIRVLLGAIDVQNAWSEGLITVKTDLSKNKTKELLLTLFPRKQFLTFDYW